MFKIFVNIIEGNIIEGNIIDICFMCGLYNVILNVFCVIKGGFILY